MKLQSNTIYTFQGVKCVPISEDEVFCFCVTNNGFNGSFSSSKHGLEHYPATKRLLSDVASGLSIDLDTKISDLDFSLMSEYEYIDFVIFNRVPISQLPIVNEDVRFFYRTEKSHKELNY